MTQIFGHFGPSAPWLASALLAGIAVPLIALQGKAAAPAPA
jgi:hypothetical protein